MEIEPVGAMVVSAELRRLTFWPFGPKILFSQFGKQPFSSASSADISWEASLTIFITRRPRARPASELYGTRSL